MYLPEVRGVLRVKLTEHIDLSPTARRSSSRPDIDCEANGARRKPYSVRRMPGADEQAQIAVHLKPTVGAGFHVPQSSRLGNGWWSLPIHSSWCFGVDRHSPVPSLAVCPRSS